MGASIGLNLSPAELIGVEASRSVEFGMMESKAVDGVRRPDRPEDRAGFLR